VVGNGLTGQNGRYYTATCLPLGSDCLVILLAYLCNIPDRTEMFIAYFFTQRSCHQGAEAHTPKRSSEPTQMAPKRQKVYVRAGNLIQVLKAQITAETKGHPFIWSRQPESPDTGLLWGAG